VVKDRYHTLDALRGAAALLVVLRHCGDFWGDVAFTFSYLAVDFFFLLSGFILGGAYERKLQGGMSVMAFVRLRAARLHPIYIVSLIVAVLLNAARIYMYQKNGGDPGNFSDFSSLILFFISGILLLPVAGPAGIFPLNFPAWSLFFEFYGNIVYGVLVKWLTTVRLLLVAAVSGIVLAIMAWQSGTGGIDSGYTLDTLPFGLLRFALSFSGGILLRRLFDARGQVRGRNDWAALAVFLVFSAVLVFPDLGAGGNLLYVLVSVLLVFPLIIYVGAKVEPGPAIGAVFSFLGLISYPIYIFHLLVIPVVRLVARKIGFPYEAYAPYSGLALLLVCVLVAWIVGRFIEPVARKAFVGAWDRTAVLFARR